MADLDHISQLDYLESETSDEEEQRQSSFDNSIFSSQHSPHSRNESEEMPLCRICRGEATELEPLFHPCKCSGSIKYVHQNW